MCPLIAENPILCGSFILVRCEQLNNAEIYIRILAFELHVYREKSSNYILYICNVYYLCSPKLMDIIKFCDCNSILVRPLLVSIATGEDAD